MCRIAVLPAGYKGTKIVSLLNHLEKEKGGDGNGFSWVDNANKFQIVKGLKVKNNFINKIQPKSEMVLYHTRMVSAGDKDDANCHPFYTMDEDKPFVLCHNGTWSTYSEYKKILLMLSQIGVEDYKEWSDTRLMAWLIENQGIDRLYLPSSGVWVQYFGDHAIVHVKSGDFCGYKIGKKWIYASEFPEEEYKEVWEFAANSIVQITADDGFKVLYGDKPKKVINQTTWVSPANAWKGNSRDYSYHRYDYEDTGYYGYVGAGSVKSVDDKIESNIRRGSKSTFRHFEDKLESGAEDEAREESDLVVGKPDPAETLRAKVYFYDSIDGGKTELCY